MARPKSTTNSYAWCQLGWVTWSLPWIYGTILVISGELNVDLQYIIFHPFANSSGVKWRRHLFFSGFLAHTHTGLSKNRKSPMIINDPGSMAPQKPIDHQPISISGYPNSWCLKKQHLRMVEEAKSPLENPWPCGFWFLFNSDRCRLRIWRHSPWALPIIRRESPHHLVHRSFEARDGSWRGLLLLLLWPIISIIITIYYYCVYIYIIIYIMIINGLYISVINYCYD